MTLSESIRLVFAAGPKRIDPVLIDPGTRVVLGRGSGCDLVLDDQAGSVSRRHLEVSQLESSAHEGGWVAIDLGSRNGSVVDGEPIEAGMPATLHHGSRLQIGSWVFRVVSGDGLSDGANMQSTLVHTLDDTSEATKRYERVQDEPLAALASHRLAALLECSDLIHSSTDLTEAGTAALNAMLQSTGYARGAFVRPHDESDALETLAFESRVASEDVTCVQFSRSLLTMAAEGEVVRVSSVGGMGDYGQSIAELDIHSAICIPVMSENTPIGYLYLDARGAENTVQRDDSSFGRAVGRLLGLTAANLRNKELELRQISFQHDLDTAASAQRLLLPASTGQIGDIAYSMSMRPGRFVAGDLFGVAPLDDDRVCVFLGDVSGKGAGSAILMATTQSYIHAMLEQTSDLQELITKLNRHIADRSHGGMFVTMWIGIFNPRGEDGRTTIEFIDGGHGHWLVTRDGEDAKRPGYTGGLVVGIDPNYRYKTETISLDASQRLVLFSDGVVEQKSPSTDQEFGLVRTGQILSGCSSSAQDVECLVASVIEHARSEQLDDDMTIASIGVTSGE